MNHPPFRGKLSPVDRLNSRAQTASLDRSDLFEASLDASAYLLVIDGSSSRRFPLPREGMLFVGRSSECEICVAAAAASRRHAKFLVADGEVQVTDLKSHNGTLVNGERLEGSRLLSSGDVVAIGDALLILRREPRAPDRAVVDLGRWRRRLEEELERAGDYGRPLAVVAVSMNGMRDRGAAGSRAAAALRLIDVLAWNGGAQLVALMPELGAEAAHAAALELLEALAPLAPEVRGGLASYPADGCDAETLVSGAAAAAAIAAPGTVAGAADTAVRHDVGGREIVLADAAMIRVFELIRRLAASDLSVLVLGETGAGKENAAAALHHWSDRAGMPMITLNCAALPETLVESELFGYERGAFSDARAPKPGLLERAHGGTVFLDEVGELPLGAQAKLLRALEARRITRLGDVREREVDFRIIAATNRDLEVERREGRFREDLLFRLSTAVVELPPLRHRPREVPILARLFLAGARARVGKQALELSEAALAKLAAYTFPGNVRELKNAMEFAAATAESDVVELWNLPDRIVGREAAAPPSSGAPSTPARFRPIADELKEIERRRMQEALEATGGVQTRAAELIGMPARTFVFKLKQYGIDARPAKRRS
ncbi:Fis family transcriptional regulator [Sorangium cellulosum]|uniref:Fis family transcriptional regulator n=1 Tax=Sorangium cellulosum TaxID=56 RepID=A0A2L0F114_SORCE|nr:sigma 54-interacting transcriptional regulator [Sorangium cellulosum]AUX45254.1 Fis family transcriptional regulator [Sorangium cellulosum]